MDASENNGKDAANKARAKRAFGKMVLALACFLALDVVLLMLNLAASLDISGDALTINLAGRQRMLSQSMAKSVLQVDIDAARGLGNRAALTELKNASVLFDTTLKGLKQGAFTTGSDDKSVFLPALKSPEGLEIVARAEAIWLPYKALLTPLMKQTKVGDEHFSADQLIVLEWYARENNLKLLDLMNDLTTHLEQLANAKAQRMLWAQALGLLLIFLNCGYLVSQYRVYSRAKVPFRSVHHSLHGNW